MVGHNYYPPHADRHSSNSNEDVLLTLRAMVGQEERYSVVDYLSSQNDEDHLMLPVMPSESSERNNSININRRSSPSSGHSPSVQNNAAVPARRDLIDSDCRTILVEWAYRVVDHFHIGREVVAYAMNYVDRFCSHHFISSERILDKNSYKLIVTSSLYLALKLHHEGERAHQKCYESSWHYYNRSNPGLVSPTVEDYDGDDSDGHGRRDSNGSRFGEGMSSRLTTILPYLTRGEHTQAHLDRFETILIQTMGFYLHPPLATCFVQEYMHVLRMWNSSSGSNFVQDDLLGDLCHEANIFVDLSVAEYDAATVRPSLIALAALLNAMTLLERRQQQEDEEESGSSRTLIFQSLRSFLLEKIVPSSQEDAAAVAPLVPEAGRQPPSLPFSSVSRDMVSNNTVASVSCCPILKNHDDIQDLKNIQILLWELRFDSSQEGYESPVNNDPSAASAAAMDVEDEETRQDSVAAGRAGTAAAGHNHKSNHGSSSGSDNDEDDVDDSGEDMFPRLSPTSTTQLL